MVLPGGGQAVAHGDPVVPGLEPFLVDAGDEEHLVVHGQAEEDGEQHHRQERLDGAGPVHAEEAAQPSPLEDGHQDPEGGADGEHVHGRRDSGMTMLRNTTASNRNDSSTTRPMNRGNLADRTWAKSMKMAVVPPTWTVRPVPRRPPGWSVVRRWSIEVRSSSAAWGALVG